MRPSHRTRGKQNSVTCCAWQGVQGPASPPLQRRCAGVADWRELREEIPELVEDPWLFPQLGRRRRDGSFPDAGGQLSTSAVIRIVRPVMLAAGVPVERAHPHTLRHTFGRLCIAAPRAELSRLQCIMGHASPEPRAATSTTQTTSSRPSISGSTACAPIPCHAASSSASSAPQAEPPSTGAR